MGLLDQFLGGQYSQDPEENAAIKQGLLATGLGLLGSKGSLSSALGQAGQQGMGAYQGARDSAQSRKLKKMQIEQQQAAMADQERQRLFLQNLQSPQGVANSAALAGGGGPTMGNAAKIAPVDPNQQMLFDAVKAGAMPLSGYMASLQKDNSPLTVADGAALIDRKTMKPIFENKKAEAVDPFIRMLTQSGIDPMSPQGQQLIRAKLQKDTTHAPGTSVSINTEKPLLNTVAAGLGKQIDGSLGEARAAVSSIATAQSLRQAVDSGKIVAGPGASFRIFGLQVGQMLGVGGKDAAEVLGNTRAAIQSMAKAELDAAQMMKGQGQITEAERDIIRRAAAGDIDKLTAPEVRQLSETMEKTARFKIKVHRSNLKGLADMPGAAPLLPFYQVEDPGAYQAPAAAGGSGVRRYNPATGRLE